MRITQAKLTNFRNYSGAMVTFGAGVNLICGPNGQGKTNLAESLLVASLGSSPRTHHDEELVKMGATDVSRVEVDVQRNFGNINISYNLLPTKDFFINGSAVKKLGELFGNLVTVYFSPKQLEIVTGGPQERRDFMDTDISQLSGKYYNLVQRYNKVLFQRNKLLKTNHDHKAILDQIDIWDEQLASLAAPIIRTRKNFIEKLSVPASEALQQLSKSTEQLSIEYIGSKGNTTAEIKAEILAALKLNLSRDMELGYTGLGPHRDDIAILLNGQDSKAYCSQGQQRSIVLALKLGELGLFKAELGEAPVLVLDDVFSELDSTRQKRLYTILEGYQTVLTGTAFKFKPPKDMECRVIKVKDGKIKTQ